jgi:hypothetical protein
MALVFGWRGLVWSQIVVFAVFTAFTGWRAAIFLTPLFTASHALGLLAARRLARGWAWLSRERATIALLAGAVLAPAVPSLLDSTTLRFIGLFTSRFLVPRLKIVFPQETAGTAIL